MATIAGTSGADTIDSLMGGSGGPAGAGDDSIVGLAGNDWLYGLGGNDTLAGGLGGDRLWGGDGNDDLTGGDGEDSLFGGAGDDIFQIAPGDHAYFTGNRADYSVMVGPGIITIADPRPGAPDGTDRIYGALDGLVFTGLTLSVTLHFADSPIGPGTPGADSLFGSGAADTLDGLGGNDTLLGGDGHDRLLGGSGNDSLVGGGGEDLLLGGSGNDVLRAAAGDEPTYLGLRQDYAISGTPDMIIVRDLRSGTSDGADTIYGADRIAFADRTYAAEIVGATPDMRADVLDSGYHWPGQVVTFSIPVAGSQWNGEQQATSAGYRVLSADEAARFRTLVSLWDEVTALDLVE